MTVMSAGLLHDVVQKSDSIIHNVPPFPQKLHDWK